MHCMNDSLFQKPPSTLSHTTGGTVKTVPLPSVLNKIRRVGVEDASSCYLLPPTSGTDTSELTLFLFLPYIDLSRSRKRSRPPTLHRSTWGYSIRLRSLERDQYVECPITRHLETISWKSKFSRKWGIIVSILIVGIIIRVGSLGTLIEY